jgi:putative two-component system response regulator
MTNPQPGLKTILCVDDVPQNLELLGSLLEGRYRIKVAISGERALKILANGDLPDLILLDVVMPGLSGWDVCGIIKEDPRLAGIPVVFLTGKTDPEDLQAGIRLGAVASISKPVLPETLLAMVEKCLNP